MNADLIHRVWQRARSRCEYCQLPAAFHPAPLPELHLRQARDTAFPHRYGAFEATRCFARLGQAKPLRNRLSYQKTCLAHVETPEWPEGTRPGCPQVVSFVGVGWSGAATACFSQRRKAREELQEHLVRSRRITKLSSKLSRVFPKCACLPLRALRLCEKQFWRRRTGRPDCGMGRRRAGALCSRRQGVQVAQDFLLCDRLGNGTPRGLLQDPSLSLTHVRTIAAAMLGVVRDHEHLNPAQGLTMQTIRIRYALGLESRMERWGPIRPRFESRLEGGGQETEQLLLELLFALN